MPTTVSFFSGTHPTQKRQGQNSESSGFFLGCLCENFHEESNAWISHCDFKKPRIGIIQNAWFLAHRIRLSMNEDYVQQTLKGIVEVDETSVGGKPRKDNHHGYGPKNKHGRGTDKVPVMALVERNGVAFSKPIKNVDSKTLKGTIKQFRLANP